MSTSTRRLFSVVIAIGIAATLAGCTAGGSAKAGARISAIAVLDSKDLGDILVDGKGNVLYAFKPDNASTVSCTFGCATVWPPLSVADNASTAAGDGVDVALLGKLPNPAGGHVVTYNGWPLYRYAADKAPGQHRGQDVFLNGGYWYVMKPDGKPLMP
ncbi:hypothetical protein HUF15_38775 [Streptomyces samsunensis]|uniref:COG4315 family predicted lipoprotein n=1 Tax=Streptomyces malaysiensis TaxID=92644 RepID=UPI0015827FCA|nr:hypothetical protein [Streptomyces samsunensis]NUH42601.1 hypothetical protein [Streptomyces samsunensis]